MDGIRTQKQIDEAVQRLLQNGLSADEIVDAIQRQLPVGINIEATGLSKEMFEQMRIVNKDW